MRVATRLWTYRRPPRPREVWSAMRNAWQVSFGVRFTNNAPASLGTRQLCLRKQGNETSRRASISEHCNSVAFVRSEYRPALPLILAP